MPDHAGHEGVRIVANAFLWAWVGTGLQRRDRHRPGALALFGPLRIRR
jgi:hypothetical protein